MPDIANQIRKRLKERNISAHAFEKKAGISKSTLQNILQGRSKNPSINVLKSVASALECTLSELLGDTDAGYFKETDEHVTWVPERYAYAVSVTWKACKDANFSLSRERFFEVAQEIYAYCIQYHRETVDRSFVDWVIRKKKFCDEDK